MAVPIRRRRHGWAGPGLASSAVGRYSRTTSSFGSCFRGGGRATVCPSCPISDCLLAGRGRARSAHRDGSGAGDGQRRGLGGAVRAAPAHRGGHQDPRTGDGRDRRRPRPPPTPRLRRPPERHRLAPRRHRPDRRRPRLSRGPDCGRPARSRRPAGPRRTPPAGRSGGGGAERPARLALVRGDEVDVLATFDPWPTRPKAAARRSGWPPTPSSSTSATSRWQWRSRLMRPPGWRSPWPAASSPSPSPRPPRRRPPHQNSAKARRQQVAAPPLPPPPDR